MGIINPLIRRLNNIALINKIVTAIRIYLDQEVCGVPMIEMIGMRICCYILLVVVIIRILGD